MFPGLESDVLFFNRNRALTQETNARVVLNNPDLIELAQDKWDFGEGLQRLGLPAIPSCLSADWEGCDRSSWRPSATSETPGAETDRAASPFFGTSMILPAGAGKAPTIFSSKFIGDDDASLPSAPSASATAPACRRSSSVVSCPLPAIPICRSRRASGSGQDGRDDRRPFRPLGPTSYQFRVDGEIPYLLEINPGFPAVLPCAPPSHTTKPSLAVELFLWEQTARSTGDPLGSRLAIL